MTNFEISEYFAKFSDMQLYQIAMELQAPSVSEDAQVRICAKETLGSDGLIQLIAIGIPLSNALANRLKSYSDYFGTSY